MTAADIMTKPVHTVGEDCSLEQAARTMLDKKVGCLPVVDSGGRLAGILTESDFGAKQKGIPFSLYRFPGLFGQWMPAEGVEKMYAEARTRRVGEFMNSSVVSVQASDTVETVIAAMQRTGFHRLPVVSDGKLAGIVTRHDLLRLMVRG